VAFAEQAAVTGVTANQGRWMRQDGVMQQPRNFSLYGAVDLGARQAATQRQEASAAASPGAAHSEYVFDVTEATFETDVLERSRTVPVIMDLWAEWCGPCKQLSPVLERLANEAAGAWVLAKVDVDANPQLSAALQVQSIPMVLAVIGGQLVPGFLGALPEAQVRQWLGQVLQVAQQLGLPGAGDQPEPGPEDDADTDGTAGLDALREPELAEAQQAMERGDLDAAADAFERMLANDPGHPVATVGLAQVNLFRRVNSYDPAQARKDAAAHPDDVAAQIRVADIEMSLGNAEEAFDRLLGVIRRTTGEDRDKVRQHLVGLFEIFPPRDPRVTRARSSLSSLLF
jgi:putative thioredoxin